MNLRLLSRNEIVSEFVFFRAIIPISIFDSSKRLLHSFGQYATLTDSLVESAFRINNDGHKLRRLLLRATISESNLYSNSTRLSRFTTNNTNASNAIEIKNIANCFGVRPLLMSYSPNQKGRTGK